MASASISDIPEKEGSNPQYPIHDLIRHRWSPRAFSEVDIPDNELFQLFEAMRWAPSSMNAQPWSILFARRGEKAFELLSDALMDGNRVWAKEAPVLALTMVKKMLKNGDVNGSAIHDLGLAIGNLSLQATSMGIGVHQMGGFSKSKAIKSFDIPEDLTPVTTLSIGYFGDPTKLESPFKEREIKARERNPISDFVHHGKISSAK